MWTVSSDSHSTSGSDRPALNKPSRIIKCTGAKIDGSNWPTDHHTHYLPGYHSDWRWEPFFSAYLRVPNDAPVELIRTLLRSLGAVSRLWILWFSCKFDCLKQTNSVEFFLFWLYYRWVYIFFFLFPPRGKLVTIIRFWNAIVDCVFLVCTIGFLNHAADSSPFPPSSSSTLQKLASFKHAVFDRFITDHVTSDYFALDCWCLIYQGEIISLSQSHDVASQLYNVHHHAV